MVVQIQLSAYTTTIRLQKSKKHQNTRFPKTNIPKIRPWKVPEAFVFLRQILYSSHNTSSNLQIQLTTHKEFINNSFRIIPQKSASLSLILSSSFPALPLFLPCPSLPRPSYPSIVLPPSFPALPPSFLPFHRPSYPSIVLPRPFPRSSLPFLPSSSHPYFLPTILPPRAFPCAIIPL